MNTDQKYKKLKKSIRKIKEKIERAKELRKLSSINKSL